jgi:hypothetical protein
MAWTRGYTKGVGAGGGLGLGLAGLEQLTRALNTLADPSAKKLAKAGVNAGLSPLAQALRAAVDAAPISAELKAAVRKTIGKRLKKKEGEPWTGKVGFAVGARSEQKQESAHERNMRGQGGAHETRGVGVSAADVHWFVLGTEDRWTGIARASFHGQRIQIRTGNAQHHVGRIEPLLAGLVERALSGCAGEMLEAARNKISEVLESEAARVRG